MVFLIYALGRKGLEQHKWLELLCEKEIKAPDIGILSNGRYDKNYGLNCSLGGSGHLTYFSWEKQLVVFFSIDQAFSRGCIICTLWVSSSEIQKWLVWSTVANSPASSEMLDKVTSRGLFQPIFQWKEDTRQGSSQKPGYLTQKKTPKNNTVSSLNHIKESLQTQDTSTTRQHFFFASYSLIVTSYVLISVLGIPILFCLFFKVFWGLLAVHFEKAQGINP